MPYLPGKPVDPTPVDYNASLDQVSLTPRGAVTLLDASTLVAFVRLGGG